MKIVARVGEVEDQDEFRREDFRAMTPNQRVETALDLQRRFLGWDENPRMERSARLKRIDFASARR